MNTMKHTFAGIQSVLTETEKDRIAAIFVDWVRCQREEFEKWETDDVMEMPEPWRVTELEKIETVARVLYRFDNVDSWVMKAIAKMRVKFIGRRCKLQREGKAA